VLKIVETFGRLGLAYSAPQTPYSWWGRGCYPSPKTPSPLWAFDSSVVAPVKYSGHALDVLLTQVFTDILCHCLNMFFVRCVCGQLPTTDWSSSCSLNVKLERWKENAILGKPIWGEPA